MFKKVLCAQVPLLTSIIICLLFANPAQASFDFSPIIANLTPSGASATASFTVTNYGENKIPVQVTIVSREPDEAGKEVHKENPSISELFRIFPSQVVLKPKETRTIRVSYIGSPVVKTELPFRIIAEELPVDVDDPNKVYKKAVARINIATKYIGSLYVTPSGVKPDVVVEATPAEGKAKNLILTLTNKGTSHQVIRKPVVKLKSTTGGNEVLLDGAVVKSMVNQNVLPGKTRKFILEWPKNLPTGPIKASVEFNK